MTAQILASELGNLIQESKRKHTDLRNVSQVVEPSHETLANIARLPRSLSRSSRLSEPLQKLR
jgi:protein MON2